MKNNELKGALLVYLSSIGFGTAGIFAKFAYEDGMTVGELLSLRFVIASLLFFAWIGFRKHQIPFSLRMILALSGLGGIGYAFTSMLLFQSFYTISASLAEMLFFTYPFIVSVLAYFFEKEPFTWNKWVTLALGFAGLVLILGVGAGGVHLSGVLMAIGSAITYSFFIIFSNRALKTNQSSFAASAFITLSAAVTLTVYAATSGQFHFNFGLQAWASALGVSVFSTVFAIFSLYEGLRLIGPSKAAIYGITEPVVTLLFGSLLLGDRFSGLQILGTMLILSSLLILRLREKISIDI